ncbi:MAG: DNA topoisomerase I [Parcubacteria group bacterium Licking1014_17]|nr:MAG: DNA topoisomerase I [Parcubacteria group bacterium Licking1014_17]
MQLVIVESPTKAKTISKFLGDGYTVRSSFGHVRDLPVKKLGVDVKKNFKPQYVIPAKAKKVIAELKGFLPSSDGVILATDEDREGEAIAWHLAYALDLDATKAKRIVFHEITKTAIEEALANPRVIDINLVDAQQARRILDRLVGYELSPFLWKKVRPGLSAGRVQSVTVRLVVERENEIQKFVKEEYWTVEADFAKKGEEKKFRAKLASVNDKPLEKLEIKNDKQADSIIKNLTGAEYFIKDITEKGVVRNPASPFTTSTLQQEASRKLGFSAKQTMMAAQRLYENGHITYMRTDSVNLAASAVAQAKKVIEDRFGKEYALDAPRFYATKSKGAQEAHEAVRPTNLALAPEDTKELERGQRLLYELIWKRTVACQMQQAIFNQTAVDVATNNKKGLYVFRANGQTVKFDGFIRVYTEGKDEENGEIEGQLPDLKKDEPVDLKELLPLQHFTEPPPRYTDATLIKALEAHGIGRPSTYAPTLTTIQERGYVEKIEKKYHPTEIGTVVNSLLVENFPKIVDINFTSHVEEELDEIAEGKLKWVPVVREFYEPFKRDLDKKTKSVEKIAQETDTPCPKCGKKMLLRFGRMGKYLVCPDKECGTTMPTEEEAAKIKELEEKTMDEKCPICGGPMNVKRGPWGYFLGCANYPTCKGIMKILNKTGFKCPKCKEGDVVERKSRGRGKPFYGCSRYPDCNFLMSKKSETGEELVNLLEGWKEEPKAPKKPRTKKIKESPEENPGE